MDNFTDFLGGVHDLDDPKTYAKLKYGKLSTHELWDHCIKEIGYVYMYFNFFHPDIDFGHQVSELNAFCKWFNEENGKYRFEDTEENRLWFKKFIYKFDDEFENLC